MKKNSKKRKSKVFILIFAILLAVAYYKNVINKPLKSNDETIELKIEEGESLNGLLNDLDEDGLLRNKFILKLNLKFFNNEINLLPGTYAINKDSSFNEILKILEHEDLSTAQIVVSIPEGNTVDNIALKLEEAGLFPKEEFISAVENYDLPDFISHNSNKKYDLEGFLFPDTYYFSQDTEPDVVIKIMLDNFESRLKEIERETGKDIESSKIETLITKASLVEKEAVLDEERALVASVIENRLKKNMKLEFCSTVNYVVGYDGKELLKNSDIKVDSPYNTYKYNGLPAGPICNPGKESIIAALEPADTDYLFFVSLKGQNGKQYFSTTAEEHEKVKKEQGY